MEAQDPSLLIERAYINGKFITSGHGNTFDVLDPATNVRIGSCPDLTFEEAEQAIHAADAAFPLFRATNGRHRAHLLRQWLSEIEKHADDLAALITWESGKALCDAQAEVAYAASYVEWFAEEAPRIYGTVFPSSYTGRRIASVRQPVGVCGFITPWNFPAAMVTRKVAPALAAGCTVVLKSAGETPFTVNALVELAHRAGIPPGVINAITALENTVVIGMLLTTHPKIKKVSFPEHGRRQDFDDAVFGNVEEVVHGAWRKLAFHRL
ncbi:succinate semialdehyde dehydrogenase NADP+ linked [Fusarium falciforme]